MLIALDLLYFTVLFVIPSAHMLSMMMSVGGWLGIPDVYESLAYIFRVLYIVEQCSQLGFERGYEYVFHDSGKDVDRSVGGGR